MKRKFFTTLGILVVLLVSLVGTVAAQSGSGPETTPTAAPTATATAVPTTTTTTQTTAGSKFFMHPVVKLLDAYFGEKPEADDVAATPSETPDPSVTPTAGETPDETSLDESGLTPTGEQIAAFHEDGMGFGVLVKIYAMVKASEDACKAQAGTGTDATTAAADGTTAGDNTTVEACTPLTADELVAEFKGGAGMGTLFKEYGKPALLGVGHVKQEMKAKAKDGEDTELTGDESTTQTDVTTTDAKGQKQDKEKVKQDKTKSKSNGNSNGNGKGKK